MIFFNTVSFQEQKSLFPTLLKATRLSIMAVQSGGRLCICLKFRWNTSDWDLAGILITYHI